MEFPPGHYFETAIERMRQAVFVYNEGASFALSIYIGGVAVECMLRAFKGKRTNIFDERHDLLRLFSESGIARIDRESLQRKKWSEVEVENQIRELRTAINAVYSVWSNTYRFASEKRLAAHFKRLIRSKQIKGQSSLKHHAREFLNSAQSLVNSGVAQWRP